MPRLAWSRVPTARVPLLLFTAVMLVALCAHAQAPAKDSPAAGAVAPASAAAPLHSQAATPEGATPGAAPVGPAAMVKPPMSPMVSEMMSLLQANDEKLAALGARLKAARTTDEALAAQKEIQELKQGTEISLLQIQATYARREGRTQAAEKLEATIHDLQSPQRIAATPANRPAPVRSDNNR
jgi:hypothetical protein